MSLFFRLFFAISGIFGPDVIVSQTTDTSLELSFIFVLILLGWPDLGYVVNRDEEDSFGLGDLNNCGDFCPAARRRQLGNHDNSNSTGSDSTTPQLSEGAYMEILQAAANRFRQQEQRRLEEGTEESEYYEGMVISYIYEENGHFFSRTVHRDQVMHLL